MVGVDIDTSELRSLAVQLGQAGTATERETRAVVKRAAQNIKTQMQAEARGSASFNRSDKFAASISYDVMGDGLEVEIGPDKEHIAAASLGNIAYFGTSRGGGTVPDPQGALDAEAPKLVEWLGNIGAEVLK